MSTTSPLITFVSPYFGAWPHFWRYWARSIGNNPDLTVVILTDLPAPADLPANIRIWPMSLDEVIERVEKVVGFPLQRHRLHKLCDYRPFSALAFPEVVAGAKYWGWCDMDVVWGDMEPLVAIAKRGEVDFASPYDFTAGHCTIVRNEPATARIALSTTNLRERLDAPNVSFVEERGFIETARRLGGFRYRLVDSVPEEWRKPKCFLGATICPGGRLAGTDVPTFLVHCTKDRVVLYDERASPHEMLYLHFMAMKQPHYWRLLQGSETEDFSFTQFGAVPGLLPPESVLDWRFRAKGLWSQTPAKLYSAVHGRVPKSVINRLVRLKVAMRKPSR